jgi:hypothetical protein
MLKVMDQEQSSTPVPIMQPGDKHLPITQPPRKRKWSPHLALIVLIVVLVLGLAVGAWFLGRKSAKVADNAQQTSQTEEQKAESEASLGDFDTVTLDPSKNYGDKYANGLLPVGDKKYSTGGGKKGYVYLCNANFVPESQAGAQTRGPWFTNNNTQWDINKKVQVRGTVNWDQQVSIKIENGKRVVATNALPDHHTGTFPVASSDPAYQYDRNPNTIKAQSLTYSLTANPAAGSPQCMGGEAGVMLTGVPIFNAFDAGGRDAGAWEVQDSCDGHPQSAGAYHYHTLSRCITDVSVSMVIGFALDGFPITGPKVGDKNYLTTDDLDECHGIVSDVTLDGKTVKIYHYVMTQDFPYSVSCFRATAVKSPGQQESQTQGGQQQQQGSGGADPKQLPPPPLGPDGPPEQ